MRLYRLLSVFFGRSKQSTKNTRASLSKRCCRVESLEERRLLAIDWVNQATNNFAAVYTAGDDAAIATALVARAISDWEAVITDFNYDNDNNPNTVNFLNDTYSLNISAGPIGGRGRTGIDTFINAGAGNRPTSATITLDDNGGGGVGDNWFFDTTPQDDAEFIGIADAFQASFVDATIIGQARQNDFYRTITHEIGHAMGILLDSSLTDTNASVFDVTTVNPDGSIVVAIDPTPLSPVVPNANDFFLGALNYVGIDQVSRFNPNPVSDPDGSVAAGNGFNADEEIVEYELWQYTLANNTTVTFTESGGGHFYEGVADPNVAGADQHLNELMNPGRVVPAGNNPAETTRQFISDLTVQVLADAYGYAVTLPSTLDSAHTMLDDITGTLLVQGLPGAVIDTIDITVVGANSDRVRVVVNNHAEEVPLAEVTQILISRNGGNDNITVAPELAHLRQDIDYVVSSNEDALEAVGQSTTDGIVDLSNIVPGNQTTLRAAIVEANAGTGTQSIYVGRGNYNLTLTGNDNVAAVGDLDITGDVTIVGAGAGATVIDATGLGDRVFEVLGGGSLDLSRATLAGGASGSGGAVMVRSGGTLDLTDSAVANNSVTFNGTAIRSIGGDVTVRRSVFTNNSSTASNIGGIYSSDGGSLIVGESIFALNTLGSGGAQYPNIRAMGLGSAAISLGNNAFDQLDAVSDFAFNELNDLMLTGATNFVVTSMVDKIDATDDNQVLSLREAVIAANNGGGTVWLPAWEHRLTLTGAETGTDAAVNDLDITDDVTIVGAGAGLTVISTSFSTVSDQTRIFDVQGSSSLDLSRVTLAGGGVTESQGGSAVRVRSGGTLEITESAVANLRSEVNGVAIRSTSGNVTIRRSVFTNNESTSSNLGAVYSSGSGTLTIGESIFALNKVDTMGEANPNVVAMGSVSTTSEGNNLYDNHNPLSASGTPNIFSFNGTGDYQGTTDFVVTSVADTFNHANDAYSLSLREAIDLANEASVASEIWVPAWSFVLTRDRATYGEVGVDTDTEVGYGDLDIKETLTIRRAGVPLAQGVSAVKWRADINDAVFDLLGDFTGTGTVSSPDDGDVDGGDYLIWQQQNGDGSIDPSDWEKYSADANDDGVVNGDDLDVWSMYYGKTLTLHNLIGV